MKKIIGYLFTVIGILIGLYISVWLMFVQPILEAYIYFNAGTLTGTVIGITVLKCVLANVVGGIFVWGSIILGSIIADS